MNLLFMQQNTTPVEPTNLYDPLVTDLVGYIGNGATTISSNSDSRVTYCPCAPNTTYTITMNRKYPFRVAGCASTPVIGGACTNLVAHTNHNQPIASVDTLTYTTSATAHYIGIYYWEDGYGNATDIRNSIVITKV